eukprot:comp21598_c1_seq2/m.30238 comp21598_c1_seq2/g.30238  ORF comp21598_c1_seq2/g.30238 comp21598_c1_seq2/m.30238 type:complete len:265 (-) comp21598_c1_seq2:165-959(-)
MDSEPSDHGGGTKRTHTEEEGEVVKMARTENTTQLSALEAAMASFVAETVGESVETTNLDGDGGGVDASAETGVRAEGEGVEVNAEVAVEREDVGGVHVEEVVAEGQAVTESTEAAAEVQVEEHVQAQIFFPSYSFDTPPRLLFEANIGCDVTAHGHLPKQEGCSRPANNFWKGARWAPDGTCLLGWAEDKMLRVLAMPQDWDYTRTDTGTLTARAHMCEGETIYDACWYPLMSAYDPATVCVLAATRDHPIHLWDVYEQEASP